jgi:antitoxin VapB
MLNNTPLRAVAKVFSTGNSQAVRLPKAFRVDVQEMWIVKNPETGEITLKPKNENQRQQNLDTLFRMIADEPCAEDFVPVRETNDSRNPFEQWAEPMQSIPVKKR